MRVAPVAEPSADLAAAATGKGMGAGTARRPGGLLGRLVAGAPTWLPPTLTLEGLLMYVLSLRVLPGTAGGIDLNQINGLGLISVLPAASFIAIGLMIIAFFVTLTQNTDRKGLLLFQLAAVTFALHGAAALMESEPRFHTAWVHAGFSEYIGRAGLAIPGLDARFSWPGFFALFGFISRAAGIDDLSTILRWTPLMSNLLYLLPFVLILRQVVATTRARWFAALLFIMVQWIGQDYFSPQGFTYILYLVFVAMLLRWFGRVEVPAGPPPEKGFVRRLIGRIDRMMPGELAPQRIETRDKVVLLVLLIALFTATTAAHQVTPFMMLGALTGFILLKRSTFTLALPVFLGLIVVGWISYQATPYWSGHINDLFGGVGNIFANLQENTGDRLVGSDPQHAIVLKVRLGICGAILTLAAIGLLRRLRRGVVDRVAVVLLCIPVLALGLQSYGGEIGLRVYMFALPGACLMAAYAFFPNPQLRADVPPPERPVRFLALPKWLRVDPVVSRKVAMTLAVVCALTMSVTFLVARYGNEKFERITTGEAQAMRYVYEHDSPSARVLYLVPALNQEVTPTIPWRERDIDTVDYREALAPQDPAQISSLVAQIRSLGPQTYLMASRGQTAYLELNNGYPADWGEKFRASLMASKDLKAVFTSPDAALFTLKSWPKGTEVPPPPAFQLVGDRSTTGTPFGLAALVLTWLSLFTFEVIRLNGPSVGRKAKRNMLIIAVPAFVLALGVVVERFIVLGFDTLQG